MSEKELKLLALNISFYGCREERLLAKQIRTMLAEGKDAETICKTLKIKTQN